VLRRRRLFAGVEDDARRHEVRALVVYESMYGNTHEIAEHIAAGLRSGGGVEVEVVSAGGASAERLGDVDLLVVGGPTHVHGMASSHTRQTAWREVDSPGSTLRLDPAAHDAGLREWLDALPPAGGRAAAAFDTRLDGVALITGRASHAIGKRLRQKGFDVIADGASFLVDHSNHLLPGMAERAEAWGRLLAEPPLAG
jgi:hypothetical protein